MKMTFRKYLFIFFVFLVCNANSQSRFKTYISQAYDSSQHENYPAAIALLLKAKALKNIDTSYNESINLYLGGNFEALKERDSALYYYGEGLRYFETVKDTGSLIFTYNRLGGIEQNFTKRFDKAIMYYKLQMGYSLLKKDSTDLFDCYNNISISYKALGKYDSSLHYSKIVLEKCIVRSPIRCRALLLTADIYSQQKLYNTALAYYDKSIQESIALKDSSDVCIAYINKGDCLMQIKDYINSIRYCLLAQNYFNASVTEVNKKDLYHNLSYAYSKLRNFQKAYYFKDKEDAIKDSISTQSIVEAATQTEAKYQIRKNKDSLKISQQELALSNSESRENRRNFIIAFIIAVAIGLLALFEFRNARIRQIANKELSSEKSKVEALANQLSEANQTKTMLFSIISHDLRSPISSLYSWLKLQEVKAANDEGAEGMSDQVIHLLDSMEDMLIWSKSQMDKFKLQKIVLLINDLYNDLIILYSDVAKLKHVRISNLMKQTVKLTTDENLLKTILRNIISNAINNTPPDTIIFLDAFEVMNGVVCSVTNEASEDDFKLFEKKLNGSFIGSNINGLGLVIARELITKLGATINISYSNGKIDCQIFIPYVLA